LTYEQRLWGTYCAVYSWATRVLACGATPAEIRGESSEETALLAELERRSPYEAEVYVSIRDRAIDDALARRPPRCGRSGFRD
jgi:hypothetical protein